MNISHILETRLLKTFRKSQYGKYLPEKKITVFFLGKNGIEYTSTCLIIFSKILKKYKIDASPIDIYKEISLLWEGDDIAEIKFAKGHLNFYLITEYINLLLNNSLDLIEKNPQPIKVLVDFSSPNVAKDMHVGHLRSTIIGENICRYHEELGNNVQRINHIGDFGLPFGMIVQYMYTTTPTKNLDISDLQKCYTASKKCFDKDKGFKELAYLRVAELQKGKECKTVEMWNLIKDISRKAYEEIYNRLNIKLKEVGESFYQPMIPSLIKELEEKGLLETDKGRKIIKVPGFNLPLTVVKSNGTSTYDTTDLAALRYRLVTLNMDKIYYVVGSSQAEHFKLIFKVAEMAGWKKPHQELHHIGFGLILNDEGKPFRSRSGDTEKLVDLLDKSLDKAEMSMNQLSINPTYKKKAISAIGYGAIKYYDLSFSRLTDYKFSYDKMLSLTGNTAVYLLYAYVRLSAIIRKVGEIPKGTSINIQHPKERDLGVSILRFPKVFIDVGKDFYFHILCQYVYSLSKLFHSFYKKCKCIDEDNINYSRVKICRILKKVFEKCFYLLNIDPIEYM